MKIKLSKSQWEEIDKKANWSPLDKILDDAIDMNWYKKDQEQYFNSLSLRQSQTSQKLPSIDEQQIINLIESCQSFQQSLDILKNHGLNFKILKDIAIVNINNKKYIVEEGPTMTEAYKWLSKLYENDIDKYINYPEYNDIFWKYPQIVYHGTTEEIWEKIKTQGLIPRKRSRGIENRGTGNAIFTSENPEETEIYGNIMLEINTEKMKSDGYEPYVSRESPIIEAEKRETLAQKIGIDNYLYEVEAGIYPSTIIFYEPIPPQYIKRIKRN